MCQVCAESINILPGEVIPGSMKNGEAERLKGVEQSSTFSCFHEASTDISYQASPASKVYGETISKGLYTCHS